MVLYKISKEIHRNLTRNPGPIAVGLEDRVHKQNYRITDTYSEQRSSLILGTQNNLEIRGLQLMCINKVEPG